MAGPDALGRFYAQAVLPDGAEVPNSVTVTNSGDSPPSKESAHVVDEIAVRSAAYDAGAQTLTVVATSSDKSSQHGPPAELALGDYPNATRTKTNQADPSEATLVASGVVVPPVKVRVISTKGGETSSDVSISGTLNQTFGPGVPLALDDSDTATQGTPVVIPVLLNDVSSPAAPIVGGPTILAPGPDSGTATVNPDNTISFTPGNNVGPTTFRYTVANSVGTSNVATVTVDVVAGAAGPVPTANPDPNSAPINVTTNASVTIDVLANDLANGGELDPASVKITTPPPSGTAAVDPATGRIAFTAGATAGPVTFSYTVASKTGQVSAPATVTVTVVAPENLQVQTAKCQRSSNTWDIRGTSTVSDGNSVQLFLAGTVPAAPTAAQRLSSPLPVVAGAWRLQLKGGPACTTPISALSTLGAKRENIAVQLN
ncbi:MAG: Ig-like domain-containing protein [Anaeromyxobacteraceae bacterium]